MASNYFEGISIEDLQNYDPNDDQSKVTVQTLEIDSDNKTIKDLKTGVEIIDNVDLSFDLDELANITVSEGDKEQANKDNKQSKPASVDKSSSVTNTLLSTLASNLRKAGILDELSDEELEGIADEDKLYDVIQKQIKANEYKSLTEDQKLYLEAIKSGIPEEDFAINRKNSAYFKNIDDEALADNKQLQADLIYQGFLIKGFSKEEASEYAISIVKSDANAYDKALKSKDSIIKYNDDVLLKEIKAEEDKVKLKQEDNRKKLNELKTKIESSTELVPGITINKTTKDKIYNSITKSVAVDEDGVPMNEVLDKYIKDADYKMKLHAFHILTNGFTDFSKINTETKTKIVKSLKEEFDNTSSRSGGFGHSGILTSEKIASMIPNFK